MIFDFNKEAFQGEIVDREHYFRLAYCTTLDIYLMFCVVSWVAWYDRYYLISQEDYELYKADREAFYQKFEKEIQQGRDCFTERFVGSAALRDYDGETGFHMAFPVNAGETNPFQHHAYIDGVFYARICWDNNEIYVPPVQAVLQSDGNFRFPLRDKCEYQFDKDGHAICFKLISTNLT